MIEKIIPGDSQEELIKAVGQMVHVFESSRHIKQAASPMFSRKDLEDHAPPKGMFLTHAVTMGSSEMFGGNRNSDLFPHEQLLSKHATFVTHGKNYREHANKDPRKALGPIVAERYDPTLHRGEVLFWSDIEKCAKEFEKARKGEEQHGSMACNIDRDICEVCGFQSKYAHERCDHIRHTPGKYFRKEQKYARMINIDPTFKDYSWVARPADRIAHTMEYLTPHDKAASEGRTLRGDELALAYGATPWLEPLKAIAEFDLRPDSPIKCAAKQHVFDRAYDGQFDQDLVEKIANHPYPGKVLRSLEKKAMVMPLATFNSFVTGVSLSQSLADPTVKEASEKMAQIRVTVIRQMGGDDPEFSSNFGQAVNELAPMQCGCEDVVDNLMNDIKDKFSLRYEALAKCAQHNPTKVVVPVSTFPPSKEARALGTLYQAYLVRHVDQDWVTAGALSALR